jgi:hypothetical protein
LPGQERRPQKIPVSDAYSAEKVRGGEIILRIRGQRLVFIAGLGAAFVLVLVLWAVAI